MATVLIIIVTWNKKAHLLRLLAALKEIAYPQSAYDILVVDNASDDGTAEAVAAAFPHVQLIRNTENLGGSGGFNTGLQWAFDQPEGSYAYLWLLDNDVVVHRQALSQLVAALQAHEGIGIAGSTMMQTDAPWTVHEMGGFLDRRRGGLKLHRHGLQIEAFRSKALADLLNSDISCGELAGEGGLADVEYVAAASLLVSTELARRNGLFRNYFIHFDDIEWCLRMARMGYRSVACGSSLIWHASSSSYNIPDLFYYYNNRNLLNLLRDYGQDDAVIPRMKRWVWLKALILALRGKIRASYFHRKAIDDFEKDAMGKYVDCQLTWSTQLFFRWPTFRELRLPRV